MRIPHFVQLMLKYVVPVYLITIFAMFCWNNVPSQDVNVATLDASVIAGLQEGELSPTLLATLAVHDVEAPAGSKLVNDGSDWQIIDADDALLFTLNADKEGVALERHKAGYYENIVNNPVALASVMFIAIILAFLLLLVHIAGRRWEAEGRLTYS
jgi:hypothetical protein